MVNRRKDLGFRLSILFLASLLAASCSGLKKIPPGEYLYTKGEVLIDSDTIPKQYIAPLTEELEKLLRPSPNMSFLGIRPKLSIFNSIDSPRNESSIKGWLKYKIGEPPVYLSDVNRDYNTNLLRNRLENLGFFNAQVVSDTTLKKKTAEVTYTATPGIIYRIRSVVFEVDSASDIGKAIRSTESQTLLQVNRPFNLNTIISERERIDNMLKNLGYYYFSPDYLLIEVDSTAGNHHVDLFVTVKPETPQKAKQLYRIRNIVIFPNFTQAQTRPRIPPYTELYRNQFLIVDPEKTYRKFALARTMFFKKGDHYNRNSHTRALNQLVGMGTFRFVKNDFLEVDTIDANLLDVHYYLTPSPKRGLRIELLGKTASVYNGSEVNVNWINRNTFKSGETLTISVFGGFETQTGGNVNLNSSFYRYGIEANLSFPRIIAPFNWEPSRRFVPRTFFKTGYEYLHRQSAYSLNSMRFSFGYMWKESYEKEHELDVLEIGYVQPRNITETYRRQMDSIPSLRHTVEPQFTFGPTYTFTYTNTVQPELKHQYYFKGGLDLSANVYGLILGANAKKGEVYQIFNANFAQYVKTEGDFRYYLKLGKNQTLANRAMIGIGYAYGNSTALPYVKQFFAGGPNGLRSFRARAVGPGSYKPIYLDDQNFFADQTGDLKLELNTEYRAKIAGIFHWAAFIDAGNIWLLNKNEDKPGAQISRQFYNELAVGGGLGLRFDFSFLILRTDLAIPFRKPYLDKGQRWVFDEIRFQNKDWRRNNLIFNLAIGYPF
jgi:outer membrane protein assembly factor BamA